MRVAGRSVAATLVASSMALRFDSATVVIPHPAKVSTGGEDAWFVRAEKGKGGVARRVGESFGVFDGVGGWAEEGIDPGVFSRAFAKGTADALTEQASTSESATGIDLERAMATGLSGVRAIGTSTACLVHVNADGRLQVSSGHHLASQRCNHAHRENFAVLPTPPPTPPTCI